MTDSLKILQINNHHVLKGGSERVYLETGKMLAARGHEVRYFSSSTDPVESRNATLVKQSELNRPGLLSKIAHIPEFIYSKRVATALEAELELHRPDIAHLHIFYGHLTSSILPVLAKFDIPVVMSVHEYRMLCPAYTLLDGDGRICEDCAGGNYLHAVKKRCNKKSITISAVSALECFIRDKFFSYQDYISRFIMVSQFCSDIHTKYFPKMSAKSTTLFNFVNLANFVPRFSHSDGFLYLGRLSTEKGVETLVDTASKLPNLPLKIVGDGPCAASLRSKAKDHSNIEFLGFKSGIELQDLVRDCKFVVVPSEWYENNPMSVIEAFALGKPVIGANIGGIPELVHPGKTGYLFESGDEASLMQVLERCMEMPEEEYSVMAKEARSWAEANHNASTHYEELIDIYRISKAHRSTLDS